MNPSEEFLSHAADCQRMAKFTRDPASKATRNRMAKRWLQYAGGFNRRVEVAGLAREFRRLAGAVGENERRVELVEVALRPQRFLHLVRELDVSRALGEPHRL